MLTAQIAEVLRSARKSLRLSQKDAASRSEVSHRLWAEVERGERPNVSLETALRMLGEVGVTIRLTNPHGNVTDDRDPRMAAAARATFRRMNWTGRHLRLDQEGAEPAEDGGGAERLAAVAFVSQEAFAVARGRTFGTSKTSRATGRVIEKSSRANVR